MAQAFNATLTTAGLAALISAQTAGLQAVISHVALGRGWQSGNPGYVPAAGMTALYSEFARAAVTGGSKLDATTLLVEASVGLTLTGAVHEIGVFLSDGTLLAVFSDPSGPLTYAVAGEDYLFALTLALVGVPPGAVTWTAGAPSLNLMLATPLADLAAGVLGLQRREIADLATASSTFMAAQRAAY